MSGRLGLRKKKGRKPVKIMTGPLSLTQILDSPEMASAEEIERAVTHMYTVGFEGPVTS